MKTKPTAELLGLIDAETEAFVIGTILQGGDPAFRQAEFLDVDDFGVKIHRVVFRAIKALAIEVHPTIDAVADHLSQAGKLDSVGGLSGLVDLDAKGVSGMPIAGFGQTLRRKSNRPARASAEREIDGNSGAWVLREQRRGPQRCGRAAVPRS